MSLMQFFRVLWLRRWVIMGLTLAALAIGFVVVKLMPQKYSAHSRVMLELVKPDPVTGQVLATNSANVYIGTQLELITDYRVTGTVVDQMGWMKNPSLLEQYRKSGMTEQMTFHRWLAQKVTDNTEAKVLIGTNILEITNTSPNPEIARQIADQLRAAFVEQSIAFRQNTAQRNAEWFRQQANNISAELAKVEAEKSAYEKANNVVLQDDYTDPDSDRLRALASQATAPIAGGAPVAGVSASAGQLSQIDAQISSLSQSLGPNHPQIMALKGQRAAVASAAAQEQAAALAAARSASATGPSVQSQIASQQAKVLAQRGKIDELRKIQARIEVLRGQYNKTMSRVGELSLEAASRESGLSLLGGAVAPNEPTSPKVGLILGGAIGGGLALGLMLALGLELVKRKVRSAADLTMEEVHVIGLLPAPPATKEEGSRWRGMFGGGAAGSAPA